MRFCWAQYVFWAMIAALGILGMLSGCGAKGDLYLPPEQEQAKPVTPDTTNDNNQTE